MEIIPIGREYTAFNSRDVLYVSKACVTTVVKGVREGSVYVLQVCHLHGVIYKGRKVIQHHLHLHGYRYYLREMFM